ncbi:MULTISPECIES: hypothetical protein [Clostridiaceae]|uniref:hypothetical protein n=1 Tax=Clostridiaceae TaxID=31979 RepID=UPI0005589E5B|nr:MULTISPECIES: hypothetical protein [Clostridiaceae]
MYHQLKQANLRLNIYAKKHLPPNAIKRLRTAAVVIALLSLIVFKLKQGFRNKNVMSLRAKTGYSLFSMLSVIAIAALTAFTVYISYQRKRKVIRELPILGQEVKK